MINVCCYMSLFKLGSRHLHFLDHFLYVLLLLSVLLISHSLLSLKISNRCRKHGIRSNSVQYYNIV